MRNCALCLKTGPHFHIIVEGHGRVTSVEYISTKEYWDWELPKDEYTVGYRDQGGVQFPVSAIRRWLHAVTTKVLEFLKNPTHDWLTPKVYKGKSMHEEEAEKQPGWQVYTGDPDEEAEDLS
jgi:hypothetical protein